MVTLREKIEYHDLQISIESDEIPESGFFLTGQTPLFKLVIENDTPNSRKGKILIRWRLGELTTHRIITFDVEPNSINNKYDLEKEWLYREGTGIYELVIFSNRPEMSLKWTSEGFVASARSAPIHPLCSYYVKDKDLYKYEKYHRIIIIGFTLITIGIAIANMIIFMLSSM